MADMYVPLMLTKAPRKFRYIIIHDTNCQWQNFNNFKIDNNLFQAGPMRARFKTDKNYYEMPYHYVCEKIGNNYQTFVGRPLQYSCEREFPDIDHYKTRYAIHVCIMGNYNVMSHTPKMYEQLCYRVIGPMMKLYRIPRSRVFFHGDLSKEHTDCPGFNFSKNAMFAYMSRFMIGQNT